MPAIVSGRFAKVVPPGLTRGAIFLRSKMDGRVKPGHDAVHLMHG